MNLAVTTTTIPNSLVENLLLFEPREIVILLVLFYSPNINKNKIEELSGLSDVEVNKYLGNLLKFSVINSQSEESGYFIKASGIDLDGLRKRKAPKASQTKITFDTMIDTQGQKVIVNGWENFMITTKMVDIQRRMIYLFFIAVGFDVNQPMVYIQDISDWKLQAFKLSQIVKENIWLIKAAVDKLKEDNMTVTTIRSILKTATALGLNGGIPTVKKENSKETITETW